jgi:hypothetical protein
VGVELENGDRRVVPDARPLSVGREEMPLARVNKVEGEDNRCRREAER